VIDTSSIISILLLPNTFNLSISTMRSFDQTSSPVLALSPSLPPQPSYNMASNRPTFNSPFPTGINTSPQAPSWSNRTPISAPSSAAGRKRSRDEAASNLEEDYFPVQQPTTVPAPPENEEDWEYGEGMTLIKPSGAGYIVPAESQTGTWVEEKAEAEARAIRIPSPERPSLRSAKSQRLDFSSTPAIAEEVMSNGSLITPLSTSPSNGFTEPAIDDFTRHLGIGWSLISANEGIQAAARGWSKFIDKHFPITDAKIRLESRGLASYLVEANEGYFLFGEDLKQGRLVSTSLEKTFENLKGSVPIFDGEGVMEAGDSPKVNGGDSPVANEAQVEAMAVDAVAINGGRGVAGQTLEVEMDMS
jgi:hypothetical protein